VALQELDEKEIEEARKRRQEREANEQWVAPLSCADPDQHSCHRGRRR